MRVGYGRLLHSRFIELSVVAGASASDSILPDEDRTVLKIWGGIEQGATDPSITAFALGNATGQDAPVDETDPRWVRVPTYIMIDLEGRIGSIYFGASSTGTVTEYIRVVSDRPIVLASD